MNIELSRHIDNRLSRGGKPARHFTHSTRTPAKRSNRRFHSATLDELNRAAELADTSTNSIRQYRRAANVPDFSAPIADNIEALGDTLIERASLETALAKCPLRRRTRTNMRAACECSPTCSTKAHGSMPASIMRFPTASRCQNLTSARCSARSARSRFFVRATSRSHIRSRAATRRRLSRPAVRSSSMPTSLIPEPPNLSASRSQKLSKNAACPKAFLACLFSDGYEIGQALVKHPAIKAVGFTGSRRGGRALMDIAAARPEPIPVYTEMSSVNPTFILPSAIEERGEALADGLHASVTGGVGQFCTKPGLVFLPERRPRRILFQISNLKSQILDAAPLLTGGIQKSYNDASEARKTEVDGFHGKHRQRNCTDSR